MRRTLVIALSSALILQVAPMVAAQGTSGVNTSGVLRGNAQNSAGQALANQTVQARDLQTGQIVGTSITSGTGAFSFSQLTPARYVVEIVDNQQVVGVTAPVAVTAGAMAAGTVSATASRGLPAAAPARAPGAPAAVALVVTAALAAGVRGVALPVGKTVSPSR